MLAYHDHTDEQRTQQLVARIQGGESMALISDAGTPLVSDPDLPLGAFGAPSGSQGSAGAGRLRFDCGAQCVGVAVGSIQF